MVSLVVLAVAATLAALAWRSSDLSVKYLSVAVFLIALILITQQVQLLPWLK